MIVDSGSISRRVKILHQSDDSVKHAWVTYETTHGGQIVRRCTQSLLLVKSLPTKKYLIAVKEWPRAKKGYPLHSLTPIF